MHRPVKVHPPTSAVKVADPEHHPVYRCTLPTARPWLTEPINPNLMWSFALEYTGRSPPLVSPRPMGLAAAFSPGGFRLGGMRADRTPRKGRLAGYDGTVNPGVRLGGTDISRWGWRRSFRSIVRSGLTSACARRPPIFF